MRPEDIKKELNKLMEVYTGLTLNIKASLIQTFIYAFSALPVDIFLSQEMRDELLESLRDIMTDIYDQERRLGRRRNSPLKK